MMKKLLALLTSVLTLASTTPSTPTTQTQNHNPDNWAIDYCDSSIEIVDWNTDGNELAFTLSDGTELYAYKSENIYKPERKAYIALDQIADMEKDSHGNIEIYDTDGNVYTVFIVGEY